MMQRIQNQHSVTTWGVGWGGRWEGGSRGRRRVYLMPNHVDVWQKKKKKKSQYY